MLKQELSRLRSMFDHLDLNKLCSSAVFVKSITESENKALTAIFNSDVRGFEEFMLTYTRDSTSRPTCFHKIPELEQDGCLVHLVDMLITWAIHVSEISQTRKCTGELFLEGFIYLSTAIADVAFLKGVCVETNFHQTHIPENAHELLRVTVAILFGTRYAYLRHRLVSPCMVENGPICVLDAIKFVTRLCAFTRRGIQVMDESQLMGIGDTNRTIPLQEYLDARDDNIEYVRHTEPLCEYRPMQIGRDTT